MSSFQNLYYPTLSIRRAEMVAAEKLPNQEYSKMLPIILFSPWMNAYSLDNSHNRLRTSFGSNNLIIDLDKSYSRHSNKYDKNRIPKAYTEPRENPAQLEFFAMIDDDLEGTTAFIEMIKANENYIPCLQFHEKSDNAIRLQIEEFVSLERGLAIRIELSRIADFKFIERFSHRLDGEDICFILDGGYVDNHNIEQLRFRSAIDFISEHIEDPKFVTVTSNFPNDFSEFDDLNTVVIEAREVYRSVRMATNFQVFYGDWGSTKPRKDDGFGSAPLPRIDFPTKRSWIIARSKTQSWGFGDASQQIVQLGEWEDKPDIWGADLIERTSLGLPDSIYNNNLNMAARINMHLFIQNNYSTDDFDEIDTTETWTDPAS